ncbi:ferredoxin III, nif-specific [Niveibacterium sp. SC-1]|uniref:ferredoxin III, nif-specific n=1 Tax=Niveibacterium sp. SC-1 TaxID=3135646 RepID=UPI00311FEA2B
MSTFSITLPSGQLWTPRFVTHLNQEKCIGCARCVRVCANDVLELAGVNEDGELVVVDPDSDEDEEYEKKVMTLARKENCVGCQACSKVCPKKCYTHATVEV